MVGAASDCRSNTLDRVNHKLGASGIAFTRIHTPNKSFLNPAESYTLLSARLCRFFHLLSIISDNVPQLSSDCIVWVYKSATCLFLWGRQCSTETPLFVRPASALTLSFRLYPYEKVIIAPTGRIDNGRVLEICATFEISVRNFVDKNHCFFVITIIACSLNLPKMFRGDVWW